MINVLKVKSYFRHIVENEGTILRIIDRSLSNASRGTLGTCDTSSGAKEERDQKDCTEFDVDNILELFQAITSDIMGEVSHIGQLQLLFIDKKTFLNFTIRTWRLI